MKKVFLTVFVLLAVVLSFNVISCVTYSTPESSVKAIIYSIDTLGGDSYDAIKIVDNIWEHFSIARNENNEYIVYADIITNNSTQPGALIIYLDGKKYMISGPNDWDIDDVNVTSLGTAKYWSVHAKLSTDIISTILESANIYLRAVNGNGYMGKDQGINVSIISEELKAFLQK